MPAEEHTAVARIAKSFGLSGELMVSLYDVFPADFDPAEPLFVEIDGLAVPLFCDRFRRRGQRSALVVFLDFESERRAAELVGHELYLEARSWDEEDDGPDDDVIYLEDMVGLRADFGDGREGTIDELIDGENPLFVVTVEGREVYVPAVDEMIAETDMDGGVIRFSLPEGLIDLNGT